MKPAHFFCIFKTFFVIVIANRTYILSKFYLKYFVCMFLKVLIKCNQLDFLCMGVFFLFSRTTQFTKVSDTYGFWYKLLYLLILFALD